MGTLEGTNAFVAFVTDGQKVSGYVCDSSRISRWLGTGDLKDSEAQLKTRTGEVLGTLRISDKTASGEITLEGIKHAFTAQLASGLAGLYQAVKGALQEATGCTEVGWIDDGKGGQRGAANRRTSDDAPPQITAAPHLDPSQTQIEIPGVGVVDVQKVQTPDFTISC